MEAKIAINKVVWGNYSRSVNETLETLFPGEDNAEKRRTLLRGFLESPTKNTIAINRTGTPVAVDPDILKECTIDEIRPLIEEYIRAACLAGQILDSRSIDGFLKLLATARNTELNYGSMLSEMQSLRLPVDQGGDLSETIIRVTSRQEIPFLNALDATIDFLLRTQTKTEQSRYFVSGKVDFRRLSPCWKMQNERTHAEVLTPNFSIPVTQDGVFYSPTDAENRVTDTEARQKKEALQRQLSEALNAGRLQEDVVPITPEDHRDKGNRRILTAEQRALAAEAAQRTAEEKIQELEGRLAAQAGELAREKDGHSRAEATAASRELALKSALGELQTKKDDLAAITGGLEQRNRELIEAKKSLKAAEKGKVELARITAALEIAIQNAGFFGGIPKKTAQDILKPPTQEQK